MTPGEAYEEEKTAPEGAVERTLDGALEAVRPPWQTNTRATLYPATVTAT